MDRPEAIKRIRQLVDSDLVPLAHKLGITIWKGDKLNKGWAGHTIERYLGLPINSSRAPNFGSWELKVVPVRLHGNQTLQVKETMAITMIDPVEVANKEFADSHLLLKLRKIVVVTRIFEDKSESRSLLHSAGEFDLGNLDVYRQVNEDYNLVRDTIRTKGFGALTGKMGVLVQPRTKGPGHGSTSRAFYARARFVEKILGLS